MTATGTVDPKEAETQSLRRSMNDLLSVLALPAMWAGNEAGEIVHTLAEALRGMLALDLVYIAVDGTTDGPAIEAALTSPSAEVLGDASTVGARLSSLLGTQRDLWPATAHGRLSSKDLSLSIVRLGLGRNLGVIVAAADRPDFPSAQDRLLSNVSASQVAVALHEARLRDEQRRIAAHEVSERQRVEEAMRQNAFDAHAAIDGIPGFVAILGPDGAIESLNRQILDYFGLPIDEVRNWGTNGIIHPADAPRVIDVFARAIAAGVPYQDEQRLRGVDGVYRWFASRGVPVRHASGRVARWYILLTDIEDRKRIDTLLAGEKQLLEMIASGQSLPDVLAALCKVVEGAASGCYCDIHPIDWSGPTIAYAVAPSLPESYTGPIAGTPLRAEVVPCGIAARENVQVISEDFDTDPRWCTAPVRTHVLEHGLRSVWSTPIRSKTGSVLGTLCIYHRQPAVPLPHHQDLIGRATQIASIAIERLEAEHELRRSQASLEDAQHISHTGSFSWFVKADTHVYSEQLRRIFEFEDGIEVTSARIAERVHPDDVLLLNQKRATVIEGGDNPEYEIRLQMPDGRVKYVRVFGRAIKRSDGVVEVIGAIQDVTAQRHAEDSLNKVRSDLAHVTRVMSLGTLAASIAHEVNQPLSGIITNANTCLRMLATEPPDVAGALATARRTIRDGHRASEVVTRLRALFRKTEFAAVAVDIHRATREVIALSHQELRQHRVSVQTDFGDGVPLVIGDRVQLQQVIFNLFLNAVDSLKAVHGRERRIVVKTRMRDGVEFAVSDNGAGLDPDHAAKVFDAFFTTKADGMGIGLSVSQSIIERHGGRLRATPNEDGGATFSFFLPPHDARA
jgi:PAS domain S-box-containing protein